MPRLALLALAAQLLPLEVNVLVGAGSVLSVEGCTHGEYSPGNKGRRNQLLAMTPFADYRISYAINKPYFEAHALDEIILDKILLVVII